MVRSSGAALRPTRVSLAPRSLDSEDENFLESISKMITGLTDASTQAPHTVQGASARLRDGSDHMSKICGRRPRLLLIPSIQQTGSGPTASQPCQPYAPEAISVGELPPFLADCGFDVDLGPPKRTPLEIGRLAVEADAHAVLFFAKEGDAIEISEVSKAIKDLGAEGEIDVVALVSGSLPKETKGEEEGTIVLPASTALPDLADLLLKRAMMKGG